MTGNNNQPKIMTDKELQDFISLKKYEQPEEGYFDDFLVEFQQRQRSEILNTSARGLLLERVKAWFGEFGAMRWVMGAGAAYAAVALVLNVIPNQEAGGNVVASVDVIVEETDAVRLIPADRKNAEDSSEMTPVSMVFTDPVDFSGPTPAFSAEERIF